MKTINEHQLAFKRRADPLGADEPRQDAGVGGEDALAPHL
jgi:hypothetical protein